MYSFNLNDLHAAFSPDQISRATELLNSDPNCDLAIHQAGALITARLQLALDLSVRVYCRIDSSGHQLRFSGECNCENAPDCEHVATVLLLCLDRQAPRNISEQETRHCSGPVIQSQNLKHTLVYVLHANDSNPGELGVDIQLARVQADRGYSHHQPYRLNHALPRTPPNFVHPSDLAILNQLLDIPSDQRGLRILHGPTGARILQTLLDSQRCISHTKTRQNIQIANARPLRAYWDMDPFGTQHLRWQCTPKATLLLGLKPAYFYDESTNTCGLLENAFDDIAMEQLLALPPVPATEIKHWQQRLAGQFSRAALPTLQPVKVYRIRSAPTPVLTLSTVTGQNDWLSPSQTVDQLSLQLDYQGVLIGRNEPDHRMTEKGLALIERDHNLENHFAEQLHRPGWQAHTDIAATGHQDCLIGPDDADAWLDFQQLHLESLKQQGWNIRYQNFRYRLVSCQQWRYEITPPQDGDWVDFQLLTQVEGSTINLLPALAQLLKRYPSGLPRAGAHKDLALVIPGDRIIPVSIDRIRSLYETLFELEQCKPETQRLRLHRYQAARLAELEQRGDAPLHWHDSDALRRLSQQLQNIRTIPHSEPPQGLKATLRGYQQQGLDWMQFLHRHRLAGILADDMGLGKTVQALTHILREKQQGHLDRPCLLLSPTSLLFNWRSEARRFTPSLKVLVLHGAQRHSDFKRIAQYDLVITSYSLLLRDRDILLAQAFYMLVLDEAQWIKNPDAQASRLVRRISTRHRLCLTGTPMENHLGELWALFDFLMPGLLGTRQQFRSHFRQPIEQQNDQGARARLNRRIAPFMLRRSKSMVATELPKKSTMTRIIPLQQEQQALYENIRLAMHSDIRQSIRQQGHSRSRMLILNALLKLRQICCDPRLLDSTLSGTPPPSAKLKLLMELLPQMLAEGRKILLFSQFTGMLQLIEQELSTHNIPYTKLTGRTRDRNAPVQAFQQGRVPLFLISLKAGGVGLNLTRADTVIHYDPWWNPAAEHQATDRAHRIGQTQPVFVYKLICAATVEERIQQMQIQKQALLDQLHDTRQGQLPQWNEHDLEQLLSPLE